MAWASPVDAVAGEDMMMMSNGSDKLLRLWRVHEEIEIKKEGEGSEHGGLYRREKHACLGRTLTDQIDWHPNAH